MSLPHIYMLQITDLTTDEITEVPLETSKSLWTIGRGELNSIRLPHPKISRYHAHILQLRLGFTAKLAFVLKDGSVMGQSSTNGTFIRVGDQTLPLPTDGVILDLTTQIMLGPELMMRLMQAEEKTVLAAA